jgi:hypothetical protein
MEVIKTSRRISYDDYEPDEFEKAFRQEEYDYENPICERCGCRMVKVRKDIGNFGYYRDEWECENC